MTVWSKCAHSHLFELHSNSSLVKPASYPILLWFSSKNQISLARAQEIFGAFLKQLTWSQFGSHLQRLFRRFSEQKFISGSDSKKSLFFNPVCFPRAELRPFLVLEWRMHFNPTCSNVYATHLATISHFNFNGISTGRSEVWTSWKTDTCIAYTV